MFRPSRHACLLFLSLLALAQLASAQQDPFAPSLRWTHSAPISDPWIPESAHFGSDGEMIWASGNFGSPRLMLLASPGEILGEVLREDASVSDSITVLSALTRSSSGAVFSIAQYADPDPLHRRTEISRYSPLESPGGTAMAPIWTREAGFVTNGAAKVVCDDYGRTVVAAVWNNATGNVQLDWIGGLNGNLVRRLQIPMSGVNVLDLSLDGRRVALSGGSDLYLFETSTGNVIYHETLAAATNAVALSGDGKTLVVGGFSEVRILRDVGSAIQRVLSIPGGVNELPTRVDLSANGDTLAIGWWTFTTGVDSRYEIVDALTGTTQNNYGQFGTVGGLQNFPQAVVLTRDGSRAAFGGWGSGGAEPEVLLVERGVSTPILSISLPGSVRALDLDATGTRVIVGSKNVHANQFGMRGELRLYETGERDLVQLAPATVGGEFELAARRPGAQAVLFLAGVRNSQPTHAFAFQGALTLTRRLPLHIEFRPADATGRADATFSIPTDPHWTGHSVSVQALFRMGGGVQVLSETTLTPLVF